MQLGQYYVQPYNPGESKTFFSLNSYLTNAPMLDEIGQINKGMIFTVVLFQMFPHSSPRLYGANVQYHNTSSFGVLHSAERYCVESIEWYAHRERHRVVEKLACSESQRQELRHWLKHLWRESRIYVPRVSGSRSQNYPLVLAERLCSERENGDATDSDHAIQYRWPNIQALRRV